MTVSELLFCLACGEIRIASVKRDVAVSGFTPEKKNEIFRISNLQKKQIEQIGDNEINLRGFIRAYKCQKHYTNKFHKALNRADYLKLIKYFSH